MGNFADNHADDKFSDNKFAGWEGRFTPAGLAKLNPSDHPSAPIHDALIH
jgi:hypothetical protein